MSLGPGDKIMKRLLVILLLSSSAAAYANEASPSIHRFYLDYLVVQHSLKNDEGVSSKLMALAEANMNVADFIAEFWWSKAKKECRASMEEVAKRYAKKITASSSEVDKQKLEKQAKGEVDQCVYSIYYDHWEEINRMIEHRFENLSKSEREH